MFSLASGLYTQYFSPQQINLLVVGVKSSGKSTILERIKVTDFPSSSTSINTPLAVESAISTIASSTEEELPLHDHHHHPKGPTPELLRTKIFLSENPHDFDAPPRRPRQKKIDAETEKPPTSRFAWICPPPPKFGAGGSRPLKDTSDRDSSDHDNNHHNDWFDDDTNDDSDDDTQHEVLSMNSEKPYEAARARTMQRSNSNPTLTELAHHQHQHHHRGGPMGLPAPRRISNTNESTGRMESIDLGPPPGATVAAAAASSSRGGEDHDIHQQQQHKIHQYDLKPGAKMLPLEKIRPTIGMNLAKTEICGAKVHVFDVSGKLQNLWERYYADADAVLFVWKLSRSDAVGKSNQNDDDNDSDSDEHPFVTAEQQKRALEQVRSAVADDIPFVVLGHLFQTNPPYNCEPDVLYSTSQLLPHYHNPVQALFLGNAVTGQGLKTCLEWLIHAAKRQQRIRERQANLGKH